jgi:hypothetical protein
LSLKEFGRDIRTTHKFPSFIRPFKLFGRLLRVQDIILNSASSIENFSDGLNPHLWRQKLLFAKDPFYLKVGVTFNFPRFVSIIPNRQDRLAKIFNVTFNRFQYLDKDEALIIPALEIVSWDRILEALTNLIPLPVDIEFESMTDSERFIVLSNFGLSCRVDKIRLHRNQWNEEYPFGYLKCNILFAENMVNFPFK